MLGVSSQVSESRTADGYPDLNRTSMLWNQTSMFETDCILVQSDCLGFSSLRISDGAGMSFARINRDSPQSGEINYDYKTSHSHRRIYDES